MNISRSLLALLALLSPCFAGCAHGLGRGSPHTIFSYADILEVHRIDAGKDIQMKLDQKLFFNFDKESGVSGKWSLDEYNNRTLLLLNEHPTTASGYWGILFQARGLGSSYVKLKFTPDDETKSSLSLTFDVSIHR